MVLCHENFNDIKIIIIICNQLQYFAIVVSHRIQLFWEKSSTIITKYKKKLKTHT